MTRRLAWLGVCAALLAGGAGGEPDQGAARRWFTELEPARQESRKTGKPLFVVFRCEH